MTTRRTCTALAACLLFAHLSQGQAQNDAAEATAYQPGIEIERPAGAATATVTLTGQHGKTASFTFDAGEPVMLTPETLAEAGLDDDLYRFRASFSPELDAARLEAMAQSRVEGGNQTHISELPDVFGALRLDKDGLLLIDAPDQQAAGPVEDPPATRAQVIVDDLVVQGSTCTGLDCASTETFGFDTFRLKENNLRIHFEDTSTSASFPTTDWRIVINDSANGGASYFAVEDATAGRRPFLLEADAPASSLYLDDQGNLGLGTNQPVLNLHVVDGDTPTMRLDQSGASGFTPQAWDVAGNETNFFVRDTTNGSLLPFRIRPSAPTSSLDIQGTGNIGFGTASPAAALHARRGASFSGEWLRIDVPDDSDPSTEDRRMVLDNAGNLFVGGAITQLSSRASKTNLVAISGGEILSRIRQLPIWTWNYLSSAADDRHIGPVAEDFYRAFGFGTSERSIAPADMAGVALAATQALTREIEARDQRIMELEARLERLEALLSGSAHQNTEH